MFHLIFKYASVFQKDFSIEHLQTALLLKFITITISILLGNVSEVL